MKHILHHLRTANSMWMSEEEQWTMIPYFFYDRGKELVQKSFDGLVEEILYQIIVHFEACRTYLLEARLPRLLAQLRHDGYDVPFMAFNPSKSVFADAMQTLQRQTPAVSRALRTLNGWTTTEVLDALHRIFWPNNGPTIKICFVIDGLDEHRDGDDRQQPNHRDMMDYLLGLEASAARSGHYVRIILASRADDIFPEYLAHRPNLPIHHYTGEAICAYAQDQVKSRVFREDPEFESMMQLCNEVTEKAEGVFLWVQLVISQMIEGYSEGNKVWQLRKELDKLPEDIETLYAMALSRRKSKYAAETYIMLQLVMHARAPLDLIRLMTATDVNLDVDNNVLDDEPPDRMKRRLASRCGGMLEVASGGPSDRQSAATVQLAHQTVKTFMEGHKAAPSIFRDGEKLLKNQGSYYMLRYCIFMAHRPLHRITRSELSSSGGNLRYLFKYGAVEDLHRTSGIGTLIRRLLGKVEPHSSPLAGDSKRGTVSSALLSSDALHVWVIHCLKSDCPIRSVCFLKTSRSYVLLMLAAAHGLCKFVATDAPNYVRAESDGQCPILWCAVCSALVDTWGYGSNLQTTDMVKFLLKTGAQPDAMHQGQSPLAFLLNWCSLPKAHDSPESTWTVVLEVVQLLLSYGASTTAWVGEDLITSMLGLAIVSTCHSAKLVYLLILSGADISALDNHDLRPLFYAVHFGNRKAVAILLNAGADPYDMGQGINGFDPATYSIEGSSFQTNMREMQDVLRDFSLENLDEIVNRADSWESKEFPSKV